MCFLCDFIRNTADEEHQQRTQTGREKHKGEAGQCVLIKVIY